MENIFLLIFIERPVAYNKFSLGAWTVMEAIKWGGSLIGFFSASFALLYFWITGDFHLHTVCSLFILVIETILITLIMNRIFRKKASSN